ncbi:MAG TPA: AMP-binding protein [Roseiflexaceae bacterium]
MTADAQIPTYEEFMARFRVEDITDLLAGDLRTGLNACYECCDRHAQPGRVALYWEGKDGQRATYTFAELQELSARFANFLRAQGVQPGDRVAGLLPRIPELLVVILGTWRAGAVYQTLFTAFGPKAIEYRVGRSEAKLVVTDEANRSKLDGVAGLPAVMTIVRGGEAPAGDFNFHTELDRQSASFEPVMRTGEDPFMLLFTSGTVGLAKGVAVSLKALPAFYAYMRFAMDVRDDDAYWNVADPGWAYGLYYAITGPLLMGHATTLYEGPFTAESTYRMLQKYKITNLAAAPTAYRLLMSGGAERASTIKGQLRVANSAGEPLNPEVIRWFEQNVGCLICDQYGQTELGMVVCNYHALRHQIHPGSMGLPMPGFRMLTVDEQLREVEPGQVGQVAIDRPQSPLFWFQGYWQQDTPAFKQHYYLTGDTAEVGPDGCFTFVGRADDIITSAGYRIGPFDVESCLIEHPAVAESAAVGKPDPERTELVKAYVVLRPGYTASPELADELQQYVKQRLSAHAYPREIEFVDALPKTPSGKIQRFILRKQEVDKARPAGSE